MIADWSRRNCWAGVARTRRGSGERRVAGAGAGGGIGRGIGRGFATYIGARRNFNSDADRLYMAAVVRAGDVSSSSARSFWRLRSVWSVGSSLPLKLKY